MRRLIAGRRRGASLVSSQFSDHAGGCTRRNYSMAKAVFDDYIASFEGGDAGAVRKMVDFWFGAGAFGKMPETLSASRIALK